MYFVVIMAFALVLSDTLPPDEALLRLFRPDTVQGLTRGAPLLATLAVVAAQLLAVAGAAGISNRLVLARLDRTTKGHDRAAAVYALGQRVLLGIIVGGLVITMIFTPWATLVRDGWGLGVLPLIGDLLVLGPFFLSVLIGWVIFYRVELRIRREAAALPDADSQGPASPASGEAAAALAAARKGRRSGEPSLGAHLLDKTRHQLLLVAAPMSLIVLLKHFVWLIKDDVNRFTALPWGADALLGVLSACVLGTTPVLLRYIWSTEPLPAGPLRDRFVRTCGRIELRYRELLLWHTHGTAINAAVMGFVGPLRYILVSDALLENLNEEEIEAVFGHEAGHVRHWHLQFFILFAVVSMYIAGGVMLLQWFCGTRWHIALLYDPDLLQLAALAALLAAWLFGFGWLSRRFERQADLYGIRCVTPEIRQCVSWCPVHGSSIPNSAASAPGTMAAALPDPNAIVTPYPGATAAPNPAATAASNRTVPMDIGIRERLPEAVNHRGAPNALCIGAASLFGRTLGRIAELNGIPKDSPSWRHGSIEDRCRLVERLARDPAALHRFDRGIFWIKFGLVAAALIGTAVAAWIYGEQIWHAVRMWRQR